MNTHLEISHVDGLLVPRQDWILVQEGHHSERGFIITIITTGI